MNDSIIGRVIDTYEITGILGKGGMGVVYQARDTTLDRRVALKMMDAGYARDEEFLKRFRSEAKALARLQSPNIVSVFALRETEIGLCLVMEYIDGGTLADRIRRDGAIPGHEAVAIFAQLATALDHAHAVGVIHRDIKPANVMLTASGQAKMTDFGLAKIQEPSANTMTVGTGGTLYYMSPEQVKGLARVDARGDIYSLGMTLYEAVVGRVPFGNNLTDFEIRQAIVDGKIPPPQKFMPHISEELAAIITKSIHKDPAKRYSSAGDMRDALTALSLHGLQAPSHAQSASDQSKPRKSKQQRPVYLAVAGVVFVVAGVLSYQLLLKEDGTKSTMNPKEPVSTASKPDTRSLTQPDPLLSVHTSPASASIMVNNSNAGVSPLRDFRIAKDAAVRLHISAGGYSPKETVITASAGERLALSFSLDKLRRPEQEDIGATRVSMAQLEVSAIPDGIVSVDGGEKSSVADKSVRLQVPAGRRRILFEHPRYGKREVSVTLTPEERRVVRCYFETQVNVAISGDAVWGMVVLDGKQTSIQAPKTLSLGPGTHRISVERSGYETVEGEQIVETEASFEPSVRRLAFTLKKK